MNSLFDIFKGNKCDTAQAASVQPVENIYGFEANDIDGKQVSLSKYQGRVCLIVNVACKWGFTGSNYTQLQELHAKYNEQGLSILAFPCNQFGGQVTWLSKVNK